jgi:hypothetical protein
MALEQVWRFTHLGQHCKITEELYKEGDGMYIPQNRNEFYDYLCGLPAEIENYPFGIFIIGDKENEFLYIAMNLSDKYLRDMAKTVKENLTIMVAFLTEGRKDEATNVAWSIINSAFSDIYK